MDIIRVRYFLAVCRNGSFTAAAKVCGVSQPSVTTGVRRLERAVGGRLFERRHPVRLTPLGAELRPLLETLETASDDIAAAVERSRHGTRSLGKPKDILGRGVRSADLTNRRRRDELDEETPDAGPPPPGPVELSERWINLLRRSSAAIELSGRAIDKFNSAWNRPGPDAMSGARADASGDGGEPSSLPS